jgi:hypothetical protein
MKISIAIKQRGDQLDAATERALEDPRHAGGGTVTTGAASKWDEGAVTACGGGSWKT